METTSTTKKVLQVLGGGIVATGLAFIILGALFISHALWAFSPFFFHKGAFLEILFKSMPYLISLAACVGVYFILRSRRKYFAIGFLIPPALLMLVFLYLFILVLLGFFGVIIK
jgi:hypothetical protein